MGMKSKKGSRFERLICARLSLWFSGLPDADWFWRTAGSGGRSTNRRKKGKSADKHAGDVCAIDPRGEDLLKVFALELKNGYNKFTIQDLLDAPLRAAKQEYQKWFDQAEESRKNSGALFWLIICKRDKREPLVMLPLEVKDLLQFSGNSWRGSGVRMRFEGKQNVLLATLQDFLENVTPSGVRALLENGRDGSGKDVRDRPEQSDR